MLLRGLLPALVQLLGFGLGNAFALALEHDPPLELSDRAQHVEPLPDYNGRPHRGPPITEKQIDLLKVFAN